MNGSLQIRKGVGADLSRVTPLLEGEGLPTSDLRAVVDLRFWVAEIDGTIRGVIALEPFGVDGLLRSLAVDPDHRQVGMGRSLVGRLEADAVADGFGRLVLLTQTAEVFFDRLGYKKIDRSAVSDAMKQAEEFLSLCPASASCMAKTLPARGAQDRGDA